METLMIDISDKEKAKQLKLILNELNFVGKVTAIRRKKAFLEALKEHDALKGSILKKKNKAIAKYL
jgi:hypothetical protein